MLPFIQEIRTKSANEQKANQAFANMETVDPDIVYNGKGPRVVAEKMINAMTSDFYNEGDQYSGMSLKKDLEAMTTYNGNTGMLGSLNAESSRSTAAAFAGAGGADGLGGQAGRAVSRYGGQLTAEQQQMQKSEFQRSKVLGGTDSLNRNTQYQNDLNKQLMSGLSVAPKA